jgi:tetratricopeptide (TPR) repeat protein
MALEDITGLARWSPSSVPRDVDLRYTLVLASVDRRELVRLLTLRLQTAAEGALEAYGSGPDPSGGLLASLRRILDGVATLLEDPGSKQAEALRDEIEEHAGGILQDREALAGQYRAQENPRGLASEARRRIDRAMAEDETSTMDRVREAAELLREHLSDEAHRNDAFAWLDLGWAMQALGHAAADLERPFAQAARVEGRGNPVFPHLARRMLARVQLEMGDGEAARASALEALDLRNDVDASYDAARAAVCAGRFEDAMSRVQGALRARQSILADALSDPFVAPLCGAIASRAVQMQTQARASFEQAMRDWSDSLRRVQAVEAMIGEPLRLPPRLSGGQREVAALLRSDDLLAAVQADAAARSRASETLEFARRRLHEMVSHHGQQAAGVEAEAGAALRQRNALLEQAQAQRESVAVQGRASLEASLPSPDRLQQGCGIAMGWGCLGFFAYLIAAFAVGAGVAIGPETTAGKLILAVIALPVALAALAQVAFGLRRAALEADLQRRVDEARQECERALAAADAAYKRSLAPIRERLDAAQAMSAKLQDAMELLDRRTDEA